MSAYDKLVDLLPTLWRPQPGDRTLLVLWIEAVGAAFDGAGIDIQHVLRAHWADTADAAIWAAHYQAERRERRLPPPNVRDAADRAELQRYPWIRDLARIGALLDLPPWHDPASLRENVEEYRLRLADIVEAYRLGLATPAALRRLVDAALPEDMAAHPARRRSRFSIEEPVALLAATDALVSTPTVEEDDRVGPLARWPLTAAATPAFVFVGTAPDAIGAATERPMIERYTPGSTPAAIGVAWTGTLAPDQALRLAPDRRTWLVRDGRLHGSPAPTSANAPRDPSANGPWSELAALAAGRAVSLSFGPDGSLWAIQRTQQTWRAQRFNGSAFSPIETDAPAGPFHALLCHGDSAWLGTDAGLFRCRLWPDDGVLRWGAVPGVTGAVRVLAVHADKLHAAGADGVHVLAADGSVLAHRHAGVDLRAWCGDGAQEVLATEEALYLHRAGRYWRYEGASASEHVADWVEDAPADGNTSPLPEVTAIAASPDGSLWFGSADGLARWYAAEDGTTRLEAFPDLVGAAVAALTVDDRGLLWIAAANGLFRYDGRDLAQHDFAAAAWIAAGHADTAYPDDVRTEPRGHWRFDRAATRWQRWSAAQRHFADANLPDRAQADAEIVAVLIAPAVRAELGAWDGTRFEPAATVPPGELRLRIKPDETRIVTGALPWLPAPSGAAGETWRYLQMDEAPAPPAQGRPWWSTEGQLFPTPSPKAPVPGHLRDAPGFLADPQGEGQFDHSAFAYPPSARLWVVRPHAPRVGIRIRLCLPDPGEAADPALAERVWKLVARARPAGVPLQLMVEGRIVKESTS